MFYSMFVSLWRDSTSRKTVECRDRPGRQRVSVGSLLALCSPAAHHRGQRSEVKLRHIQQARLTADLRSTGRCRCIALRQNMTVLTGYGGGVPVTGSGKHDVCA